MSSLAYVLNFKNLFLLDVEALADQSVLDKLSQIANDTMFELEPGTALEFYQQLDAIIKENLQYLQENRDAYNQLMVILWQLSWKALPAMPLKQSQNLLASSLVGSLKLGVNVSERLKRIIYPLEFGLGPDKELRRSWSYSMEHNQENIGERDILLEKKALRQS